MSERLTSYDILSEKYSTQRAQIEQQVDRLRVQLPSPADNLFVRGSFVRGDAPYGDIDVSAYNYGGRYKAANLPLEFDGVPISYGFIPLEHLEEYFEDCLRGTSSLMETVELTSHDSRPGQIIREQQQKFLNERGIDYLLYLKVEEDVTRRKYEAENGQDYEDLKRKKGSKRTISRMAWAYKTLFPELYAVPGTKAAFNELFEMGLLPKEICEDTEVVLSELRSTQSNRKEFDTRRKRIADWFDGELGSIINTVTKKHLPADFLDAMRVTIDPQATAQELSEVLDFSMESLDSYRKWMAIFSLSANEKLSAAQLVDILASTRGNYVYRNVVRNLLRNPSLPLDAVRVDDFIEDIYAAKAFERRLKDE